MSIVDSSFLDFNLFWPATSLFLLSFLYYIYKFVNTRNIIQNLNVGNVSNQQSHSTSSYERINQSNINENSRIINDDSGQYEENIKIKTFFQSSHNNLKESFDLIVHNTFKEALSNNIYSKLKIDVNRHKVVIIYRGKKIDENTIIKNLEGLQPNTVIHLFVTEKALNNTENEIPIINNDNANINESSSNINNSVNINTIKAHSFILLIVCFFIYQIKGEQDLIPKAALNLLFLIIAFWWTQLSYMISKIIINRNINFNN
jgi:hypothetical protein